MIPAAGRRSCDDGRMHARGNLGRTRGDVGGHGARRDLPRGRRAAARAPRAASAAPTCASFYNGDRRISPPWVLGHEISGELIEIGAQAAAEIAEMGLSVGDLVHCISTLWCGRCRMCRSGNEHLCLQRRADGLRLPGRLRRAGRDPRDRAQEPLPHPRRPLRRARHVRRPAVGRDLRPQGHRDRPRRHRRRDRRRPGRHGARRDRPARGRRPGAAAARRRANRLELARDDPRRRPHGLRRHVETSTASPRCARPPRTSAPTS